MTFLSTMFLWALPLTALPVLLHFLDRKKQKTIHWGAMEYLKVAAESGSRRRYLRNWLLLLIRTASVLALVLALAQPIISGTWLGGSGESETILILDNSLSMTRSVESFADERLSPGSKTLFQIAVEKAKTLLSDRGESESIRVMTSSPHPQWLEPLTEQGDSTSIRMSNRSPMSGLMQDLDQIQTNPGSSDLFACLANVVSAVASAPEQCRRKIIVITDNQAGNWKLEETAAWERLKSGLEELSVPVSFEIFNVCDGSPMNGSVSSNDNIAVSQIQTDSHVQGVGSPLHVTATIANHSDQPTGTLKLDWFLDGNEAAGTVLDSLSARETREVAWNVSSSQPGTYLLSCKMNADDLLTADNENQAVIHIDVRISILIVERRMVESFADERLNIESFADERLNAADEIDGDAWHLVAALGRNSQRQSEQWESVFAPDIVPIEDLASVSFHDYRAVVIPSLAQLSSESISRLEDFVKSGGGLWVGLGPRTDIENFNRDWFDVGVGLAPFELLQLSRKQPDELVKTFSVNRDNLEHPTLRHLADLQRLDLHEVRLTRQFEVKPLGAGNMNVLLNSSNGHPIAVEHSLGRGRIILQTVPLQLQWSNFVVSSAFVVAAQDWLSWLCEPLTSRRNILPGETISFRPAIPAVNGDQATLIAPDGQESVIHAISDDFGVVYQSKRTQFPGVYRLKLPKAEEPVLFHVARPQRESDLRPLNETETESLMSLISTTPQGDTIDNHKFIGKASKSSTITTSLLVLLISLICLELFLATSPIRFRPRRRTASLSGVQSETDLRRTAP